MRRPIVSAAMLFLAWAIGQTPSSATIYNLNLEIDPSKFATASGPTFSTLWTAGQFSDYGGSPITLLPGDSVNYSVTFTGNQTASLAKPSANSTLGDSYLDFGLKTDSYGYWGPDIEQSASLSIDGLSGPFVQPGDVWGGNGRDVYFGVGPVAMGIWRFGFTTQVSEVSFSGIHGTFKLDQIFNPTIYVGGVPHEGPFTSLTLTNFSLGATVEAYVPEPATWVSLLLGLFGVGAVLRNRRQERSAVTAA